MKNSKKIMKKKNCYTRYYSRCIYDENADWFQEGIEYAIDDCINKFDFSFYIVYNEDRDNIYHHQHYHHN